MATFYVLPPRERIEHELTAFWDRVLPGLPMPRRLADQLLEAAEGPGTYLVHREELPGGELLADLAEHFGAEPGDAVVEVGGSVRSSRHTLK